MRLEILTVRWCLWTHQFSDGHSGTPVKNAGFCGEWSLKNAKVLFKDSYTKDNGDYYGAVPLDRNAMVNNPSSSLAVHLKYVPRTETKDWQATSCHCWTVPFHFHPNAFGNPLVFQLCFAYKGTLKDQVGLKFTYVNTKGRTLTETAKVNTVFTKSDKWVKSMIRFFFNYFF